MKDYPMLLETNGTLPNQVKKIAKFVDFVNIMTYTSIIYLKLKIKYARYWDLYAQYWDFH